MGGVHNSEGSRNPGGDICVLEQNADDSFLEEGLFYFSKDINK